jgi:branched-chain amino acid transport system substrate-binding protein
MRKYLWVIVIIILVILMIISISKPKDTSAIKIGFIAPLSGEAASYGELTKNSVQLAVDEINKSGGIDGRQIEMIYEDGKCSGKDATTVTQKLVNIDKVKYIVGGLCSSEAFSQIPIITPAKVFTISFAASAAKLSGASEYFIRNNPSDSLAGSILADHISKSYKSVAVISEQTDYAQGLRDVFTSEIQKNNSVIITSENYSSNIIDFRSQLLKIKEQNPEILFINSQTGKNLQLIAEQARQLGIKAQLAGGQVCADPIVYTAGSATEGMICVNLASLITEEGKDFIAKYTSAYGSAPAFALYTAAAYDDIYLIKQAISSVGDDSTKVTQYLRSLPNYTGALGTYHFDSNGDIVGAGLVLQKVVNKELINI